MRDRLLRRESKNRDSHPGDPPGGAPGRGGTIAGEARAAGLEVVREYPLGDGRVSFGQVICGGERGVRGPRSCDLNCRNGSRGPGRPGHW